MVVVGYQGIGKSTLAAKDKDFIDLESGNFFINGIRESYWYLIYCNIAESLSQQGYTVLVSSHAQVRQRLKKSTEEVIAIVPNPNLKDRWIKKLFNRYESSKLEKDKKAYMNAKERCEENIQEIMDDCRVTVTIDNMDNYNLCDLINKGKLRLEINRLLDDISMDEKKLKNIKEHLSSLDEDREESISIIRNNSDDLTSVKPVLNENAILCHNAPKGSFYNSEF